MVPSRSGGGKIFFLLLLPLPMLLVMLSAPTGAIHAAPLVPGESTSDAVHDPVDAVQGLVSGKVQQVGFRAAIFRLAIQYNLAGWDENLPDGTVRFLLQGPRSRVEKVLALIPQADPKGTVSGISTAKTAVSPTLRNFTVRGWTSKSRDYTKPTDLVFSLRSPDSPVSPKEASRMYHEILKEVTGKDN